MAINSSISFTANGGASTLSGISSNATGTFGESIAIGIPASTTNQALTLAIDVSQITSIFLYTDGAMTIKTNSTGSPAQTLVFAANMPLVWVLGMPTACPLTTDVTVIYMTTGVGSTVNLYGFINLNL